MTYLQEKAYNLAKLTLDPSSRWYKDDLADMRAAYARKTDQECRDTIGRLSCRVTKDEIDRHCQFDGLPGV